jgi:hypothetical protein
MHNLQNQNKTLDISIILCTVGLKQRTRILDNIRKLSFWVEFSNFKLVYTLLIVQQLYVKLSNGLA